MHLIPISNIHFIHNGEKRVQTGGKYFDIQTGRLDGLISSTASADAGLVSTDSSAQELTQKFLAQGLGQDEMITLSGTKL